MKLLVTAGNTLVLIDKVRAITNVFTGKTGASIALHAQRLGHDVTVLTSHPEVVDVLRRDDSTLPALHNINQYRTFDDLADSMRQHIGDGPDAIVHCAAVSDYQSAGIYSAAEGTTFDTDSLTWETTGHSPTLRDMQAGKVKSDAPELWLRLVRTPKLVDKIRDEWGFRGVLVKFKLEVGAEESTLLEIAEKSRRLSKAELMVANTLEGIAECAYIGPVSGKYEKIPRSLLPSRLLQEIERIHQEQNNG